MCLQVGNEFKQVKIKDLKDQYNVEMFTTPVRSRKSICGRTKIKRTQEQDRKIKPVEDKSRTHKDHFKLWRKHKQCCKQKIWYKPKWFWKKSLSSKKVKKLFNVLRIERTKKYTINWIGMIKKICSKKVKAARRSWCWRKSTDFGQKDKKSPEQIL